MRPVVIYCRVDGTGGFWVRPCEEFFDGRFRQTQRAAPAIFRGAGVNRVTGPEKEPGELDVDHDRVARRDTTAVRDPVDDRRHG
jgi:hypothetical protein